MKSLMKVAGVVFCVALIAAIAAPVLALTPAKDDSSTRYPCIFLNKSVLGRERFWNRGEQSPVPFPLIVVLDETRMRSQLEAADNLTSFLEGRGYQVDNLRAVLETAAIAVQDNNVTAFQEAERTYMQNLHTDINNGIIERGVIAGYLGSNHAVTGAPAHIRVKNTSRVINSVITIPRWILHHMIPGH